MTTQKILVLSMVSLILSFSAQNNLVPNPSFETKLACPNNIGQIDYAVDWYKPTKGPSAYFNTCSQMMGIPFNFLGLQKAFNNGYAYAGLAAYGSLDWDTHDTVIYRNYLQAKLDSPLILGKTYYVTFFVALADSSPTAADGMGAYFSVGQVGFNTGTSADYANLPYIPQVSNPPGNMLNDATGWTRISGSFVASGGEDYITIGNFKNNDSTSVIQRGPSNPFYLNLSYYYVDQVCVSLSAQTCNENATLGLSSYNSNLLSYYYNPISDKIVFKGALDECKVRITDLGGRLVRESTLRGDADLDVSELEPGCYLVSVRYQNSFPNKRIIVE